VVVDSASSFEETPPDVDEMVRRMLIRPRLPRLVAARDVVVVGYAYASVHRTRPAYRWSADCSIGFVPTGTFQHVGTVKGQGATDVRVSSGPKYGVDDKKCWTVVRLCEEVRDMGSWPSGIGAITLFVEDLAAAKTFYQEVFGLPVAFEDDDSAVFNFGNTIINLLKTTAARELIEPAVVGHREDGSRLQFTLEVDDVDAMCAELATRGVELLNGPVDRPWGVRTASFSDPGGHLWEIAQ